MRLRRSNSLGALMIAAQCALHALPAHADDAADKAAAEALFDEARRLMAERRYTSACPKLEASLRLDPGVGTMLNLADCYEKTGRTASAWAQFRETIAAARKAGSIEREEIARSRARALEPQLSYLTIVTWQGQEVQVKHDGSPVDAAMLGTAIPVDPGSHVIVASADGKRSWSTTVEVGEGADKVKVAVPILPDDAQSAEGRPLPAPDASTQGAAGSDARSPGSGQLIAAAVVGGLGVVGVAVGSVFGLKAGADWDEAKTNCDPFPQCGERGKTLADDAKTEATISTIAFGVGIAGLAGGLVLWLTAPSAETAEQTAVGFGPGGVHVHGRF